MTRPSGSVAPRLLPRAARGEYMIRLHLRQFLAAGECFSDVVDLAGPGAISVMILAATSTSGGLGAHVGALLAAPVDTGAAWVTLEQITQRGTIALAVDGTTRDVRVNGHLLVQPPEKRP